MAPAKAKERKERKPHSSKDFTAFLIVLPLVDGNVDKAKEVVAKLRQEGVF